MVVGGGCGCLCGSGSLSELSEDESEEDDDDGGGRPVGGCSLSGSSRIRGRCCEGPDGKPGSLCLLLLSVSIGGGSSICMRVAVRCSASVGIAPRSTYWIPPNLFDLVG